MIKEIYQLKEIDTTLNVTQSRIDSIRKKNIVKTGCRVYENGYIGVAGTFGEPSDETWKTAIQNLNLQIPYEYEPSKDCRRIRDLRNPKLTLDDFLEKSELLLAKLREEYPQFIFSNKISLKETEVSLKNDVGLDLINYDNSVTIEVIYKHKDSVNIMDSYLQYVGREFNIDAILTEARNQLTAFETMVDVPDIEKPIIIDCYSSLSKIIESLNGEEVGRGTSIFCDKMGTRAFHEAFTLNIDRKDPEYYHVPFFDAEGSVLEEDSTSLIEDGVIVKGYTDKKNSKLFGVENTACAGADYDDVPSLETPSISINLSDKNLNELIGDEPAILCLFTEGGDCTNEGDFATPVQMAFLYQNGKYLGRLPEFSLSGNIYDMFGDDYIGYSKDKPFFGQHAIASRLKVVR